METYLNEARKKKPLKMGWTPHPASPTSRRCGWKRPGGPPDEPMPSFQRPRVPLPPGPRGRTAPRSRAACRRPHPVKALPIHEHPRGLSHHVARFQSLLQLDLMCSPFD